jgi:hypothetical protein
MAGAGKPCFGLRIECSWSLHFALRLVSAESVHGKMSLSLFHPRRFLREDVMMGAKYHALKDTKVGRRRTDAGAN